MTGVGPRGPFDEHTHEDDIMAAAKAKSGSGGKRGRGKDSGRCWPGYEPTPGKKPGAKGSCKKTGS
ncbi:MAG: hypothetical protein K2X87_14645 [Gemmataceae bacterium]|nr:hypothetical protein [Gemmataceae bacterium]